MKTPTKTGRYQTPTAEFRLMPLPYCSGPGMFSGKRPLVRAPHVGLSLFSASTFTSSTVNLLSRRTRCSRADGSMSERSVPQLSQTSTVETSSIVVVWKFSLVIEFRAAHVSRFWSGDFLVSSLSDCDGGVLEFLPVFLVGVSRKMVITIPNRRYNPLKKPHRLLLKFGPLFAPRQCQPCSHRTRRAEKHCLQLPLVLPVLPSV